MNDLERLDPTPALFQLLLGRGAPIAAVDLAGALHCDVERAERIIARAVVECEARLDAQGRVAAIAGLSVVPDRHELEIAGRRYWTWCAFDAIGILAALRIDGTVRTRDPESGAAIELAFHAGRPPASSAALFLPEMGVCGAAEWCPNANLFSSERHARTWARVRALDGRIASLPEAAAIGADHWSALVPIQLGSRADMSRSGASSDAGGS